jgi:Fe-Mn family superoxide dismutase
MVKDPMINIQELLDISDTLDQSGLQKEADLLDQQIYSISKIAKKGHHRSGLLETTVSQHQELFDNYGKAKEHFEKEYRKVVKSNNEVDSPNMGALREIAGSYAHNCNGFRLHEIFFQDVINSKPYPAEKAPQIIDLFSELYDGGYKAFLSELPRLAKVPRNGWVLLNFCTITKKLYLDPIDLHDQNVITISVPVMALDMWEHSYYADFGLDKEAYVKWFLSRLDWRGVYKRIKNLQRLR